MVDIHFVKLKYKTSKTLERSLVHKNAISPKLPSLWVAGYILSQFTISVMTNDQTTKKNP